MRVKTVAALLMRHRVRRIDAETVLETLRQPALVVAHLEVAFSQLDVVARQLVRAYREIDRLTAAMARLAPSPGDEPGTQGQRDVEILNSLPLQAPGRSGVSRRRDAPRSGSSVRPVPHADPDLDG